MHTVEAMAPLSNEKGSEGWGDSQRVEGIKHMVTEEDSTSGGAHTTPCADDASRNCTTDPSIILLIDITPINLI